MDLSTIMFIMLIFFLYLTGTIHICFIKKKSLKYICQGVAEFLLITVWAILTCVMSTMHSSMVVAHSIEIVQEVGGS